MKPTEIRKDIPGKALREAARREKNGRIVRRLLGRAHLLEGGSRFEAEKIACLDTNNFRRWIRRFNAEGLILLLLFTTLNSKLLSYARALL